MPAFLYFYRSSRLDGKCFCVDSDTVSCFQGAVEGKKKNLKKSDYTIIYTNIYVQFGGRGTGVGFASRECVLEQGEATPSRSGRIPRWRCDRAPWENPLKFPEIEVFFLFSLVLCLFGNKCALT